MLCATMRKRTCTIYEQKNPVCIKTLRAYTGIGDAEAPSPGMLRKPEDLPYPCPRPKKFKRLATRNTLHESRPNLRQCDPNGRIMPTPPNDSDKGASTTICPRRSKNDNYTYTYTYQVFADYRLEILGKSWIYNPAWTIPIDQCR